MRFLRWWFSWWRWPFQVSQSEEGRNGQADLRYIHPYTKKSTLKVNTSFTTWGYIKTAKNAPLTSESTVTIEVQAWNATANPGRPRLVSTTSADRLGNWEVQEEDQLQRQR